jgi:hypothetical protein
MYPFGRLQRLSFIHFAHWSLFDRVPPSAKGKAAQKLPHPYLIFQTNFDRGWREYVEAFCVVMPFAMRLNWSGLRGFRRLGLRAYGFPAPQPVEPFLDYVDPKFTKEQHFYCAYPDVSTRGVIALTDARRTFGRFAGESARPPERFIGPTPAFNLLGGPRQHTDTLSVLTPVIAGREKELKDTLEDLPEGLESPLERVPFTHMARWSVVDPLPYKKQPKNRPTVDDTSYLLFTSWFDGDTFGYIRDLSSQIGETCDAIWGNCVAYPGCRNPHEFTEYMADHSIRPRLAFGGYTESVMEVRAASELHDRLEQDVRRAAMRDTVDLEKGWRRRRQPAPRP